ncbi:MAG: hypothetical protein Ct9H90mP18_09210 [Gammaproteobacteria bacterium]|nr:MAG: hypothetical protein Ct9H90mP18_09210 [Gammaproteobacteria bacterium]
MKKKLPEYMRRMVIILFYQGKKFFEIEAFSEELKSFNITVELKELDITKFEHLQNSYLH